MSGLYPASLTPTGPVDFRLTQRDLTEAPGMSEVLAASWRAANPIHSVWQWYNEPQFEEDPTFDMPKALQEAAPDLWARATTDDENIRDAFLEVSSRAEFDQVLGLIRQRDKDLTTVGRAGIPGLLSLMMVGAISPTMLIPMVGGARGAKAVYDGIKFGVAAGLIDEGAQYATDRLHTARDAAYGIAGGAVVGGLFGGVIGASRAWKAKMAYDLENSTSESVFVSRHPELGEDTVEVLSPERGSYRFTRFRDIDGSIKTREVVDGDVVFRSGRGLNAQADANGFTDPVFYEFNTNSTLPVTPKSLAVIARQIGKENPTYDDVVEFARTSGHDAVAFEGFEDLRADLADDLQTLSNNITGTPSKAQALEVKRLADEVAKLDDQLKKGFDEELRIFKEAELGPDDARLREVPQDEFASRPGITPKFGEGVRNVPEGTALSDVGGSAPPAALSAGTVQSRDAGRVAGQITPGMFGRSEYGRAVDESLQTFLGRAHWNPVIRGIQQRWSPSLRRIMPQLANPGVSLQRNAEFVAGAPGGSAEMNALSMQQAGFTRAADLLHDHYSKYVWGNASSDSVLNTAATNLQGTLGFKKDKLRFRQFREEVGNAMLDQGQSGSAIPEARAAATQIWEEVFNPLLEEAQSLGLIRTEGDLDPATLLRLYDRPKMETDPSAKDKFTRRVAQNIRRRLGEELENGWKKYNEKQVADRQFVLDSKQDDEALQKLKDNILDDLKADEENTEQFQRFQRIEDLKRELRVGTSLKDDDLTVLNEQINKLEADVKKEPSNLDLRRRLNELQETKRKSELTPTERERIKAEIEREWTSGGKAYQEFETQLRTRRERLENIEVIEKTPKRKRKALTEKIQKGISSRKLNFADAWRTRGDVDPDTGTADFNEYSADIAETLWMKVGKYGNRLPILELAEERRGAEYLYAMDLPHNEVKEFLNVDALEIALAYTRTLAPDIALTRKFSSPKMDAEIKALEAEWRLRQDELTEQAQAENWSDSRFKRRKRNLDQTYENGIRDVGIIRDRIRGIYGLPENPDAMTERMGRAMMNLNVLRLMGKVVVSSVPDTTRLLAKHGVVRTFRDAFIPLVTDLKRMRLTREELRQFGIAVDATSHMRTQELVGLFNEARRGTMVERSLEYATSRMGLWSGFDYWNQVMKQFAGSASIARTMDSIEYVLRRRAELTKGGKFDDVAAAADNRLRIAQDYLARGGINEQVARAILDEMQNPGGANRVNGANLPNTESWTDTPLVLEDGSQTTAARALAAHLMQDVNNTIITPGVDKPVFGKSGAVDSNTLTRMIFQFKSFALSSTSRTVMAGLQARDAALVQSVVTSLALGAFSYYLWAASMGGDHWDRAMNGSLDHWADQMVERSGLLGAFDLYKQLANHQALFSNATSFEGGDARRFGTGPLETFLGPSYSLLSKNLQALYLGFDDPTQSTAHRVRQMMPLQNHFLLQRLFDRIEDTTVNALSIPQERRRNTGASAGATLQ